MLADLDRPEIDALSVDKQGEPSGSVSQDCNTGGMLLFRHSNSAPAGNPKSVQGQGGKESKHFFVIPNTVRAWTPTDLTSQDCAQMRRKIKRSHPRMPFRDRMLTQLASDPSRTYGKHRRSLLSA